MYYDDIDFEAINKGQSDTKIKKFYLKKKKKLVVSDR